MKSAVFKHYFNFVKKQIKKSIGFLFFICTMHIYLKHLNNIDVNSESGKSLKFAFINLLSKKSKFFI